MLAHLVGVYACVIKKYSISISDSRKQPEHKILPDRDGLFHWSLNHKSPQLTLDWLDSKPTHSSTIKQATDLLALWRHLFISRNELLVVIGLIDLSDIRNKDKQCRNGYTPQTLV
ncbi:hypothetical protein L3V77_07160 [Vibrio sp. DW001]|uniref:hypothetical protein n=1 Tax=Vibrio sp. DW001 TaxID=2912315 RepID=UPI0023B05228|nr:hypothetical protein [Vibrio sp. DW001]WED28000.1 hypothetical protein L3V77_07160 [Vibrio sp. DW001]